MKTPFSPKASDAQEKGRRLFNELRKEALGEECDQALCLDLIRQGAEVNGHYEERNWTPLIFAAQYGFTDIVQSLLDHGADVDRKNGYDSAALSYAAYFGRTDTALLLIEHGADINMQSDKRGETALMRAAGCRREAVVALLIDKGATATLKDKNGHTAADYAAMEGHHTLAHDISVRYTRKVFAEAAEKGTSRPRKIRRRPGVLPGAPFARS
ncbi:MAG: ankyrin repeat domain-containing protein [Alphaproteobacteria bacterium]|nr:ankyrin repeat domain-containing protein [Alphaproteobacteria bacterium]